MGLLFF